MKPKDTIRTLKISKEPYGTLRNPKEPTNIARSTRKGHLITKKRLGFSPIPSLGPKY